MFRVGTLRGRSPLGGSSPGTPCPVLSSIVGRPRYRPPCPRTVVTRRRIPANSTILVMCACARECSSCIWLRHRWRHLVSLRAGARCAARNTRRRLSAYETRGNRLSPGRLVLSPARPSRRSCRPHWPPSGRTTRRTGRGLVADLRPTRPCARGHAGDTSAPSSTSPPRSPLAHPMTSRCRRPSSSPRTADRRPLPAWSVRATPPSAPVPRDRTRPPGSGCRRRANRASTDAAGSPSLAGDRRARTTSPQPSSRRRTRAGSCTARARRARPPPARR